MATVVLRFEPARVESLRDVFRTSDFRFETRPNALFLARRPGVTATAYASGKLLLTGEQAEEYAGYLAHGSHGLGLSRDPGSVPAEAPSGLPEGFPRVGQDESGKGDYFGPLVVAAVSVADAAVAAGLVAKGVRDSKDVPDATALLVGSLVASRCPHEIVALDPPEYNARIQAAGNLNRLLAWAHAKALAALLGRIPAPAVVVVDEFSAPALDRAIEDMGLRVPVRQMPRAEATEVAVAAASLLARAEFLRRLAALSERFGRPLPKGAGPRTVLAARTLVDRFGRAALGDAAKLHFANTRAVDRERP